MVFEGLSERLQQVVKKLRGSGRVSEKDIKETMREIKLVLLEADVNFKVVKNLISRVSEKALNHEILESLTPGHQIIEILYNELVSLMGGEQSKLEFSQSPPTIYMMVGLQGSGKTTTSGKLANWAKSQGKRPLLVACDVYRPAAIDQLQKVGANVDIPVFCLKDIKDPVRIVKEALEHAKSFRNDVIIVDTAGRLHIDDQLMDELAKIKSQFSPHQILLVIDAMIGQDAVNVADGFDSKLGIDGIILTKLDGDTRGGAALSVKEITGKPIKFVGMGEKTSDLEPFYPDRMASRILGMGDVLSLIEKAKETFDEKQALEMERKMRTQQFTLDDFLVQMQQIKKMGSLNQIISMIPGMDANLLKDAKIDEKELIHVEAIIKSMTKKERTDTSIINGSRRERIAKGSGTSIQRVNKLIREFEQMKKLMKSLMGGMGKHGKKGSAGLRGFRFKR